jgi:hypothetical protein
MTDLTHQEYETFFIPKKMPEPRPWVGLTDDEIDRLEDAIDPAMYRVFARRVEQLLKKKNT